MTIIEMHKSVHGVVYLGLTHKKNQCKSYRDLDNLILRVMQCFKTMGGNVRRGHPEPIP